MSYLDALSDEARELIRTRLVTGYATVSAAGVPIDTPTFVFPQTDLSTINVATGLAYPAKADRARRNAKVGLLLEGRPDQPVISIAGRAAVRDADLQANLERYVRETILTPMISPEINDWESRVRPAVHYLSRIIIEITPAHIRWWPNQAAMDETPKEWRAPPGTVFPLSDGTPPGKPSPAPQWDMPTWQELAKSALATGWKSSLTLCDKDGYPLPIATREVSECEGGFRIVMPRAVPWTAGKATLSFMGWNVFIGDVTFEHGVHVIRVERALPTLPLCKSDVDLLKPEADAAERLMERLHYETARRGQQLPRVPEVPPPPTELAQVRARFASEWTPVREG